MRRFIIKQCKLDDIRRDYRSYCKNGGFFFSMAGGIFFLAISLVLNHLADNYVNSHVGTYVTDILLDNIPAMFSRHFS